MQQYDISWYPGSTDEAFTGAKPGSVLSLRYWNTLSDQTVHVRLLTEPTARTTWHGNVHHSIFRRSEWLEFQIATGELVFDHRKKLLGEPEWQAYFPECDTPQPAIPAVVAWRTERRPHHSPVASIWWGELGQGAEEFLQQVLKELPQPLAVEERFALRDNAPVTVLVAAEPSPERDTLIREQLTHPLVNVRTADTAEETMASLEGTDVVIVADVLPPHAGEKPKGTSCIGFIRDELMPLGIPRIGWPVYADQHLQDAYGYHNHGWTMMHLQADCGRVLGGKPEPERAALDLVLDAMGVTTTRV